MTTNIKNEKENGREREKKKTKQKNNILSGSFFMRVNLKKRQTRREKGDKERREKEDFGSLQR